MASLSWDPEKGEEGRPEGAVCIPGLCRLVPVPLSHPNAPGSSAPAGFERATHSLGISVGQSSPWHSNDVCPHQRLESFCPVIRSWSSATF